MPRPTKNSTGRIRGNEDQVPPEENNLNLANQETTEDNQSLDNNQLTEHNEDNNQTQIDTEDSLLNTNQDDQLTDNNQISN